MRGQTFLIMAFGTLLAALLLVGGAGSKVSLATALIGAAGAMALYGAAASREADASRLRAESHLRESEHFARASLNALATHVAILDEQGTIIDANHAWKEAYGYETSLVKGDELRPGARTDLEIAIECVLGGATEDYITETADGECCYLNRVTRFNLGGETRIVIAREDITAQKKSERLLSLSEQRFRNASAVTSDIVYECELQTFEVQTFEPRGSPFANEQRFPATYAEFKRSLHPEDAERVTSEIDRVVREGESTELSYRVVLKTGETRHWVDRARVIRDQDGTPITWIGAINDITEQRLAELEFARREKLLEAVIRNALDAVVLISRERLILEWNSQAEQIFGWTRDEVIGRHFDEVLIPARYRNLFCRGLQHFDRFANKRIEATARRRDGEVFPIEMSLSQVEVDGEGLYAAFVRDISDRRAAEIESANFTSIFRSSHDAIIGMKLDGTVESWNPAAAMIYGKSASEMVGHSIFDIMSEERQRVIRLGLERVAHGVYVSLFEYCRDTPMGKVWLTVTMSPIRNAKGAITGAAAIVRDTTEYKRTEEAVRGREEADRANRAKSEFLSRMSHELRTPLNAIIGFSQLLEMQAGEGRIAESARHITKAGRHLLNLINEILDIARIESGNLKLAIETFDLNGVLGEAIDFMTPIATEHQVEILRSRGPGTCLVRADRQKTIQIVLNLLANAVKFNRENGSIAVDIQDKDSDHLILSIADTGTGIDLSRIEQLFTPFERFGAENTDVEGTGLGLAVSHRFAEAMGGSLTLAQTGPEGTCFCLELQTSLEQVAQPLTLLRENIA